ncbi:carboxypeptidase-like regulatory domain-containing protein [uncultured Treponema sp.]|uniref:carboxypeptidase-like regulatory domain-containing protein n=1 Tax=uncultured Treponema sp. TaxID=162155 RepID=UPI0025FA79F8|nr:carboxypeptidase-like regulatory domain-containing protein [uncultured Treponema sp.]
MKKILALMAGVALLFTSTIFTSCSDSDDDSSSSGSSSSNKNGSLVGVVLDNKGEPVEGATVTLGSKSTKTNYGGEFEFTNVAVNDLKKVTAATTSGGANYSTDVTGTGYTLTAKKDGYLSSTVAGIYVTYRDTENPEDTRMNGLVNSLQTTYSSILTAYAGALNPASSVAEGAVAAGTAGSTATTNTTQIAGSDSVVTTTTQTGSDSAKVFKDISEAISALKTMYDSDYYTEYFSDFAGLGLVPLDASLKGKIKLNLKTQNGSTYDAETYIPTSKPKVHVSYTAGTNALTTTTTGTTVTTIGIGGTDYTWEATVDEKGNFSFDKNLPSGVPLTVTVDMFFETINGTEYCFSSQSSVISAQNTGAATTTTTAGTTVVNNTLSAITLGSGDVNDESILLMLFAQNDKFWVTDTNVDSTATGVLLKTTDELTFTFNKPMVRADFKAKDSKIANLKDTEYTATWSEDKKTVTLKPVIGYWILSDASDEITITGEAEDGATAVLATKALTAYFDTKVWVSVKTESLSDFNGGILLSDPIVLEFSKPMNEQIALTVTGSSTAYTETWNTEKTQLTLTPNGGYWDVTGTAPGGVAGTATVANLVTVVVNTNGGSSQTYHNTKFGYWKDGAIDTSTIADAVADKLAVYFDSYIDVETAKATATGHEAFTVTFSKALKSFTKDNNITKVEAYDGTSYVQIYDFDASIDAANKVVTITSKGSIFNKKGSKYKVTFKNLEVVDGSKIFRELGTKGGTTSSNKTYAAETKFGFDGLEFKPSKIEVVDSIPTTAQLSRALVNVTTAKVLKITFTKAIQKANIIVTVNSKATDGKNNYIDGNVVYIPLDAVKAVNDTIVLSGNVLSVDYVTGAANATDETATFSTDNIKKWFDYAADEFVITAALNLTGTSLVDGLDHVTGKAEYKSANTIAVGTPITFTFDADLSGYKATYKIFGLKDVDNDATTDIVILKKDGEASVAGNTVTINDNTFKAKKVVGDKSTYYVELRVDNAAGIKVFSTTSPYFGSTAKSFEETVKGFTGDDQIYDKPNTGTTSAPVDPDTTPNTNKNYGSFIVKVAEKDILVDTSLIETTTAALSKATYKAAKAVPAKSAITFTFANELAADTTASYELYDVSAKDSRKVVSSGAATIAGKVVTVQDNLMVAGQPTVNGKKITTVTQDADTGITSYFLKLEVKDAAGTVIFSSDNNLWTAPSSGTDKRTALQKALVGLVADGLFKVEVAPLAIENLSFVEEDKDNFNVGLKTYKATGINPKTDVSVKFNASIPAGAKYTYAINDGSKDVAKSAEGGVAVAAATDTITIPGEKLVASTTKINSYKLTLKVKEGDNVLFDTENAWLGKVTDYEKKLTDLQDDNSFGTNAVKFTSGTDVSVITTKALNIPVIKTQIVTKDDAKGNKSKTTKDDDKDFKKSYKSPIVLQFSHPVENYTVKLYKATKLYTAKKDPYSGTASTDFSAYAKEAVGANEATKLADFVKDGAEYIFESAQTISEDKKVITVTPANFFDMDTKVNIAVFNEKGEYVAVRDDSDNAYDSAHVVTFTTSNVAADYAQKLADSVTEAVTVDNSAASTTLKIKTDKAEIGNNAAVELTIPTECSTLSGEMPKYTVYVKPADGVYAQSGTNNDFGKDTDGAAMSAANFNLGREAAKTTVLATDTLNATTSPVVYPFKYNGTVEGIVVKVLDGKHTVYKFTLTDQKEPVLTVADDATTNPIVLTAFVKNKTTGVWQADIAEGSKFGADKTTSEAARKDFTLKVTGDEWLKSVTVAVSETTSTATGLAENAKKKTEQKKAIKYLTGETSATIAFTEAYWFIDDTITIKATDASGNESTYEIRIK